LREGSLAACLLTHARTPSRQVAKRLVQQGKRVTIRDRGFIVCLVRRTYGNLFDYEVDDAGTSDNGHADEPARPNVDMGNPSSSYRR
jgi:hypothetical protein